MRKPKFFTPNNLTFARLIMSVGVFIPLAGFNSKHTGDWVMWLVASLFLAATLTDVLDGYLARKYQMQTSLGRLLDPFVDKVLICGTFMFLAGGNFCVDGKSLTGVSAWMVVVIVSRELLVTSLRGYSEAQGKAFAATVWGKLKMFVQSATVVIVLLSVGPYRGVGWADILRITAVYATVIFTVISMLNYVSRYVELMRDSESS